MPKTTKNNSIGAYSHAKLIKIIQENAAAALTVQEVDGSPLGTEVNKLVFPNTSVTLSDSDKTATIDTAVAVQELDGSPSSTAVNKIKFPNGTVTLSDSDKTATIDISSLGGGSMSQFYLEDGDGTEITVANNKEIKFVEGGGIDINWTDTSDGSDGDPYDLTFAVNLSDLSTVTAASADYVIISDTNDSGNTKKALASDFGPDELNDLSDVTYSSGDLTITSLDTIIVGDLTIDSSGDISLDAAGSNINFKEAGTTFASINEDGDDAYFNFGTTAGTSGYGIQDDAGTLKWKNSGGSWATFGAGGSDTQIQYNNGGTAFGGISAFTWDDTDLKIGDDTKLKFGDGGDASIEYDENGTDNLRFAGAAVLFEQDVTIETNLYAGEYIYHNGDTDTYIRFTNDDINFRAGGVNMMDFTEGSAGAGGADHEITFNENGVDLDFRVESDDNTHMLFVDASTDRVGIGTSTPGCELHVSGSDPRIRADSTTGNHPGFELSEAGTRKWVIYNDPDEGHDLMFKSNVDLMQLTQTGDLELQSSGTTGIDVDKNYSDTAEASIVGLNIDFDKTGASTSNNTMYGIQLDMDNTTATNGTNYMYGLHVTPRLTHAADAGASYVYGALINAQGGSNGSSLIQGARIEAGGGDVNYGLQLDVEDGGVDLRIESSADNGDYFQIQTTTHGATTISTVDDNATAANLTFDVDGAMIIDAVNHVGVGTTDPKTALSVVHDYATTTFENQLSDGEGGGDILKYEPGGSTTLTTGRLYFLCTDGTWDETDADNTSNGSKHLLGVALGTSATTHGVLLKGFVRIPSTEVLNLPGSGATDGLPLYISTTAGHFDFNPPSASGDFVRVVGYCIDDDSSDILLYFNPDPTWVEIR